ncbi:hypothetical protein BSKO_09913 [Bryopsis sp. KO-2023]|nr:hypothetical protein BSKO_09913 [Bryopsis sp. KO-2023]
MVMETASSRLDGDARKESTADPYSRSEFLARVQTYRPSTWFAKPAELSPLVCARHGWQNSHRDLLRCDFCGACASFDIPASFAHVSEIVDAYVKTLKESHAPECAWRTATCPQDFERVQCRPRAVVLDELVARIDALERIWDLPILENSIPTELARYSSLKDKFDQLLEWNLSRMKQNYSGGQTSNAGKIDTSFVSDEAWQKRNEKLVTLALLGWNVIELSSKVYLKAAESAPSDSPGSKRKRARRDVYVKTGNPNKGYVLARETIFHCEYCACRAGGWGFGTEPGIDLPKFQRMFARNAMRARAVQGKKGSNSSQPDTILEKGIRMKTKEVKKGLVGTIAGGMVSKFGLKLESGVFGSVASQSLFQFGGMSGGTKEKRPSLESLLAEKSVGEPAGAKTSDEGKTSTHEQKAPGEATTPLQTVPEAPPTDENDGPVFGLGSYKRRRVSEVPPVESELIEKGMLENVNDDGATNIFPEDYAEVGEGPPLDPLGAHRYFCPWLVGWEEVLKSVVE